MAMFVSVRIVGCRLVLAMGCMRIVMVCRGAVCHEECLIIAERRETMDVGRMGRRERRQSD